MVSVILNILPPDYGTVINPHTLHAMQGQAHYAGIAFNIYQKHYASMWNVNFVIKIPKVMGSHSRN